MKCLFIVGLGLAVLSGCAAKPPAPFDPQNCAVAPIDGETDGGYGGTGNAPQDCPVDQ